MPAEVAPESETGSSEASAPIDVGGSEPRAKPPPGSAIGTMPPPTAPGQKGGQTSDAPKVSPTGELVRVKGT